MTHNYIEWSPELYLGNIVIFTDGELVQYADLWIL